MIGELFNFPAVDARSFWPTPTSSIPPKLAVRRNFWRKESQGIASEVHEEQGRWYYLRDLLDQLDDYFVVLAKLRASDADAYAMYSKIGGIVFNGNKWALERGLPASWLHGHRPAFCLGWQSMSGEVLDDADTITPKMSYLLKVSRTPFVQVPASGDIYKFCAHFEEADWKTTMPLECYVNVLPDGEIRALKQHMVWNQVLSRNSQRSVPQSGWRIPPRLTQWLRDRQQQNRKEGAPICQDVHELVAGNVEILAQEIDNATAGAQVRVSRGGLTAVFSIDILRTPYFFKDRELVVNENGRRKRIWHIVRTHPRRRADGSTIYVKSHFRGARRFKWNGYNVTITMPGYHAPDLRDAEFGLEEHANARLPNGMLDVDSMSEKIGGALSA